jgi:hypothetical protein
LIRVENIVLCQTKRGHSHFHVRNPCQEKGQCFIFNKWKFGPFDNVRQFLEPKLGKPFHQNQVDIRNKLYLRAAETRADAEKNQSTIMLMLMLSYWCALECIIIGNIYVFTACSYAVSYVIFSFLHKNCILRRLEIITISAAFIDCLRAIVTVK